MDTSIRALLSSAQSHKGKEQNSYLQQAYLQLKNATETRAATDAPEPFGQDLFVLAAEAALQYGSKDMARECLRLYFLKQQPSNQFLIRAYLCQAQLLAPQQANDAEQLEKAVVFLLKAISIATKTERYHFLVYNASVVYWQFCRPFLKPKYRQHLAHSLHQVVKSLDDIDDNDHEWRAQLMIALIECHLDAGRKNDASHIATAAAAFIKSNVPHLYKQVFGLMVRNELVETAKLNKDIKGSPELSIFYKICKLKNSLEYREQREYLADVTNLLIQVGVPVAKPVESAISLGRASLRDSKKNLGRRSPSSFSLSPPSEESGIAIPLKQSSSTRLGRRTPTPTSSRKLTVENPERFVLEGSLGPFLMMELAHLCLDLGFANLASECAEHMKTCNVKDQGFYLQLEFLMCQLMMKTLGDKQDTYQKPVVDLRLQAIKRCEEAIMNAIRFGDPDVLQAGCVTQWNLCLPLLQPNLRHHVRKPLTLVAEALENIHSLLMQVRCQVHTELSKCEEDQEQIHVAVEHLKKALELDDGNVYQERLEVMLRRLELRSQLYSQPERPEDQAAMIIEQARKADSGTTRMKRSLLVKAGEALAPDTFLLVLDSESDTKALSNLEKDHASGRGPLTIIKQLGAKATAFKSCVRKAEGHLKRLGDESDRERAHLWADLAKTARKQEVWDVCRVAARFCLLYDDGRWKCSRASPSKTERSRTDSRLGEGEESRSARPSSRSVLTGEYERDLVRILAEVHFINGEALVQLLKSEGIQLNDKPIPPVDSSKRPKGYVYKKPEDDPDWIEYCQWVSELSGASTRAFLRAMELGLELNEPWVVCCAAAYVWNYNNHILSSNRHTELVPVFTTLLEGLKKVGHAGETVLLVKMCSALAHGLLLPWFPSPQKGDQTPASAVVKEASSPKVPKEPQAKKPKSPVKGPAAKAKQQPTSLISPDAAPDIKKALEVCDFALGLTSGENPKDVVPIAVRLQLLHTWVVARQMAQLPINRTLGTDDEVSEDGQKLMTRAIVALEMLSMTNNGIMEFKDGPTLEEIVGLMEKATWTDLFVELQLWTRLTFLAFQAGNQHQLVVRCSAKALRFAAQGTQAKARIKDKHQNTVEQEMLSYASSLHGQSLIQNMAGKNALRREAMEAFIKSCRFAHAANNYSMVMSAARHYWNACVSLVSHPLERELLKAPLKIILDCIQDLADQAVKPMDTSPKVKIEEDKPLELAMQSDTEVEKEQKQEDASPPQSGVVSKEVGEDLTLRAAMYGVLFQAYADRGEWEDALQVMDQAIADMPRTKHRLLIFKHRVMVKAKLGQNVSMDMQKFKDESKDLQAHMWRRVALSSKELSEQLSSYQNAIEALDGPGSDYQKVDYLLELGQWLYSNEFPLQDALDQVEWAVDVLLNLHAVQDLLKKAEGVKGSTTSLDSKSSRRVTKSRSKVSLHGKSQSMTRMRSPVSSAKKTVSDTRSDASDLGKDHGSAKYIPVAKDVAIGVLPVNPALQIADLWDIPQLEALVRSHVVLAELTGRDNPCYPHILLQAYGYLMQMWQMLINEFGPALKKISAIPNPQAAEAKGERPNSPKKPQKEKDKDKDTSPAKNKGKQPRKGPVDQLPDGLDAWAVFDLPDEALETFQHEVMLKTGVSKETFPKPMLTLHYLGELVAMLREVGMTHLALPVLVLQDVLSRTLLKSQSLNLLIQARCLEVCQELDLKAGCDFHEQIIGNTRISEEDQSRSRQEIALWKEKQVQVAKEEMRIKHTIKRLSAEIKLKKKHRMSIIKKDLQESTGESKMAHIGVTLSTVSFRVVWADIGEVFIRLGYYQRAREYLNEANSAAQAYSDVALEARIMLLLGKLAFEEAQYGQAINFCRNAQALQDGDEKFWFESMMLLVDATMNDYTNRHRRTMAKQLLAHALNEFNQITNDRPNRAATLGYIMTALEAKLMEVHLSGILRHDPDVNQPRVMGAILAVCEKLDSSAEQLVRLGHRREAVPLIVKHAVQLSRLAKAATETNVQRTYYMEALDVLKEAETLAEYNYVDVLTLTSLHETRPMSLALQRELCGVVLQEAQLLVEMLQVQVKEARAQRIAHERKGSLVRLLEEFESQPPAVSSPASLRWIKHKRTLFEETVSACLAAHSLAGSVSELRAKSLLCLGRGLRLMAEHKGPDPPSQWLLHELQELLKLQQAAAEQAEAEAREREEAEAREREQAEAREREEAEAREREEAEAREREQQNTTGPATAATSVVSVVTSAVAGATTTVAGAASAVASATSTLTAANTGMTSKDSVLDNVSPKPTTAVAGVTSATSRAITAVTGTTSAVTAALSGTADAGVVNAAPSAASVTSVSVAPSALGVSSVAGVTSVGNVPSAAVVAATRPISGVSASALAEPAPEGEEDGNRVALEDDTEEQLLVKKNTALINAKKEELEISKLYFTYATECLTQALNVSLANKHKDLTGSAALELMKCCGQFDASAASQFLALFQSCQTSLHLEKLLERTHKDPTQSRLSALMQQRTRLLNGSLATNLHHSRLFASLTRTLEHDWQAWKLLEILPNHLDLVKEFPANFTFIVAQHTPDKDGLFAAVLDKSKGSYGEKSKKGANHGDASPVKGKGARIFGAETSPGQLRSLVQRFRDHKQSVQTFLLKHQYQHAQALHRQKMLENMGDRIKPFKGTLDPTREEELLLEREFRTLVADMETYLKPVTEAWEAVQKASPPSPSKEKEVKEKESKDKDTKDKDAKDKDAKDKDGKDKDGKGKEKDKGGEGHAECVVLLADADLLELPLEALECLQADHILALSRDFSLQFLYHRLHPSSEEPVKDDPGDKKKHKSESPQMLSRIPAAREAKASKQGKAPPLHRTLHSWQCAVDTANFKYIVDPNLDCAENDDNLPADKFSQLTEEYDAQFTSRWLGIMGNHHTPSVGEWEIYMKESSAFIFYGFERLLSYLPPAKLSALNIPHCMMMYILDLAQTSKSFTRQSKNDVFKRKEDVQLEDPLETAMLTSLTGTRCVLTNQWHCSLEENSTKLQLNMKDLLERGKMTGQTIRLLFSPRKRKEEEEAHSRKGSPRGRKNEPHPSPTPKKEEPASKSENKVKTADATDTKEPPETEPKKTELSEQPAKKDQASDVKLETHDLRPEMDDGLEISVHHQFSELKLEEGPAEGPAEGPVEQAAEQAPVEEDPDAIQRSWFNMVCYGLPNLVVTHESRRN